MTFKRRILHLLIAIDQFGWCVITLGRYDPDMTLSAVAWQWEMDGKRTWPRRAIDWLFSPLEADHCRVSYEYELRPRFNRAV